MRKNTLIAALGLSALILGPLAPIVPELGASPAFAKNDKGGGNGGGKGGQKGGKGKSAGKSGKPSGASKPKASAKNTVVTETTTQPANAHGKLASELKGLNAYHASETAFANASPNSQVGRIATYRDAALETYEAADALEEANGTLTEATEALSAKEAELQALDDAYTGRTTAEIDEEIAGLDPTAADYQNQVDALNEERLGAETYETDRAALETEITDASDAVTEAETGVTDAETALTEAETVEEEALMSASNGRVLSEPAFDYLRGELGL
ncbi:hypothetical protein [Defluviimonas sp. SAOS-178_SWC]|uniref:hypothetical protein n=1 Tax=Defluviimonas sp. SAOS-178_SWC TaxID=3121287 RepID=UPI00322160E9